MLIFKKCDVTIPQFSNFQGESLGLPSEIFGTSLEISRCLWTSLYLLQNPSPHSATCDSEKVERYTIGFFYLLDKILKKEVYMIII